MTKEELVAIVAAVTASIAPAAVAAPVLVKDDPIAATAGWVLDAKQAKRGKSNAKAAPVTVEPTTDAPKAPRPLAAEIQTVTYDPARHKHGAFEPFKVLVVHNGANGRFHREARLDRRFLEMILQVGPSALKQL